MNEDQARLIAQLLAQGQPITPEQRAAFRVWVLTQSDEAIEQLLLELMELVQQLEYVEPVNPDWSARLLQRISEEEVQEPAPVVVMERTSRVWWRYAAAVVLLLSVVSVYLVNKHFHQQEPPVAVRYHNDVAPGGNKATLLLADGSRVTLDDRQNGTVAQQGKVNIIKLQNGQLLYKIGGDNAVRDNKAVQPEYNTLSTPRGGQYEVMLPDGTKVWLNAASSLRFPTAFTGKERKVELTGEAYFEVAPAAKTGMPFIVQGNQYQVAVLATSFNINAYENEGYMRTTLLDGSVKVSAGAAGMILKPGQQATLKAGNITITEADTDEAVAWKNGLFQFTNADLHQVLRQLERWYNIEVDYTNIPDKHFYGIVSRSSHLSQVLNMLEVTGTVKFDIEGNKLKIK